MQGGNEFGIETKKSPQSLPLQPFYALEKKINKETNTIWAVSTSKDNRPPS